MTHFFKKLSVDEKAVKFSLSPKKSKEIKETETKDGSSSEPTPTESLRSSINTISREDFHLGRRLGKGKFGDVYLAKHKELGFLCALKIISKKTILNEKIETQLCS